MVVYFFLQITFISTKSDCSLNILVTQDSHVSGMGLTVSAVDELCRLEKKVDVVRLVRH